MDSGFAPTPAPPYYAVIFTSKQTDQDRGYEVTAKQMFELAEKQPGYLGAETVREGHALGITVSYWKDEASIRNWKRHADHLVAQHTGSRNGTSITN